MKNALNTFYSATNATLIGKGEQEKDSHYEVYKIDDQYIAIIVAGMNLDVVHAEFIKEKDIKEYVILEP